MKRMILPFIGLFLAIAPSLAQNTGFTDSFDGDLKASGPNSFDVYQHEGRLYVQVHKQSSKKWQSIHYDIGHPVNMNDHPYINFTLQSDTPFLLTIQITDGYGLYSRVDKKIYASETPVTYHCDFSASSGPNKAAITTLLFAPNGNTIDELRANIWMDDLCIGSHATPLASIGAVPPLLCFAGSVQNQIRLTDLENVQGLSARTAQGKVQNIHFSEISGSKLALLTLDCASENSGLDTLFVTVTGNKGYGDNSVAVPLVIEANIPPSLDPIADQVAAQGDTLLVRLSGIDDGNPSIVQPLVLQAQSNNQTALPDSNIRIEYQPNQPHADLYLFATQPDSNVEVTVEVDDQYPHNNRATTSFYINVFSSVNHPPRVMIPAEPFFYLQEGRQSLELTGLSDGGDGLENLQFIVSSSNQQVIADSSIHVDAFLPESRAELFFTPSSSGSTTLTLRIQDDGGTEFNNGDASAVFTFELIVANKPATGHTARMSDFKNWGIDKLGEQQSAELGSFHGKENVLKIELHVKTCWTGSMYFTPELNVDQHRYLCYDIYFEGGDFAVPPPGRGQGLTHCYFWDEGWNGSLDRNVEAAHAQRKRVYEGEWQTVLMDFRGPVGMNNNENKEINTHRIQKILFNYATNFNWPNPSDNGTVYLANIRIGSDVPDSLLPAIEPVCTIDPVADQVYFASPGEQKIKLSGISAGRGNNTTLALHVTSSDTTILPHPHITELTDNQSVLLLHPAADSTGMARVTITVSAAGARSKTISFTVEIKNQKDPVLIELARDTLFQEIKGFGTFQFEKRRHYIDLYTEDLGASAIRTGIISNQIEWANDNSDPDILDLRAFDSNAFDFTYYRELKRKGVETFILTSWSPPAWMKRNLSVAYGHASAPDYHRTDNILEPYYDNECAESMVAAVKLFRIHAGIDLYALGPQNEPAFCEPYASAVLSPDKFAVLMEIIGSRFKSEGIDTRLYMPEQVFTQNHYSMSQYISAIKSRPLADQYTDIIATHGYGTSGVNAEQPNYSGWSQMWQQAQSCQTSKELWMTETFPKYTDWNSALSLAGAIHGALVWGNVGLWTLWSIEETLITKGEPTASFYTSKNYYKYIRPGARRIRVICDDQDILASAFIHPITHQQTMVLINKGSASKNILLGGERHADEYEVYTTAQHMNFEFKGVGVKGGQVVLPASSVTTLVGEIDEPVLVNVEEKKMLPTEFQLYQNYPNPFNPTTTLCFSIPNSTQTSLVIYNLLGQRVRTLVNHSMAAGQHQIFWDGTNDAGRQVSSGVYFYRIVAGEFIATKKCVLLR